MAILSLSFRVSTLALFFTLLTPSNGLSSTTSSSVFDVNSLVAPSMPTNEQLGVEIEMPDFDELFGRIQKVSPLARAAIQQSGPYKKKELFSSGEALEWTNLEANEEKLVSSVDKIDNFQNLQVPILRFRSSLEGPCIGDAFASLIMDVNARSKWDPSIKEVYEAYPIRDLDAANILMGFGKYGDCSRLGVGYCKTKSYLAIPGREQLTLCGVQNFEDGSSVIWGTEMEDWHNHLLPGEKRTTRARSHLFCTTLVPTGENTFDVEYALQIDVGGLPNWITTPVLVQTIKSLFRHAKPFFNNEKGSNIEKFILEKEQQYKIEEKQSILMTP